MDTLTVWWDDAADGATNMAADESLAAEAERSGGLLVRVYGWSRTTVSLGAFQRLEDARRIPELAGIPLVRRPSGGGAIVSGCNWVPTSMVWAVRQNTAARGAKRRAFMGKGVTPEFGATRILTRPARRSFAGPGYSRTYLRKRRRRPLSSSLASEISLVS